MADDGRALGGAFLREAFQRDQRRIKVKVIYKLFYFPETRLLLRIADLVDQLSADFQGLGVTFTQ